MGAGDAGALVVREMQKNPQLKFVPICFVDDDPAKQKQHLHDVPVDRPNAIREFTRPRLLLLGFSLAPVPVPDLR